MKRSTRSPLPVAFALVAVALLLRSHAASAQTDVQVKPYFMVILDTSGSMYETTGTSSCRNSCGWTCRKMNDASCVLRNVYDGVGEAIFGFETFPINCSTSTTNYGDGSYSHYTAGTSNGCSGGGTVQVGISAGNTAQLRAWVDGNFSSCSTTGGIYQGDLAGTNGTGAADDRNRGGAVDDTPLAGSLSQALAYYQGASSPIRTDPYRGCRPYYVLMLTDGAETCSNDAAVIAAATALRSTWVDLNNNGAQDAGETFDIKTYAIGFGVTVGSSAASGVEEIAQNGGTDAGGGGAPYAYYASNEAQLSAGINDIISHSILHETCNGVDDNCNGQVDEGYTVGTACGAGVGVCARTGVNDCNAAGDGISCWTAARCSRTGGGCSAGTLLTPGAPTQNPETTCNDTLDNDCDGLIDCADPTNCASAPVCTGGCVPTGPEVCDGRDNDCNGQVDEGGITRSCGSAVGTCTVGTQTCQPQTAPGDGTAHWSACTGVTASPEVCDGRDNDCNGAVDDNVPGVGAACGNNTGVCRAQTACVGGTMTCQTIVGPSTELCDGLDNNCNGMVDEGVAGVGTACGNNTGVCRAQTACTSGMISCQVASGPSMEVCDGLDNDCNGAADEGLTQPCGSSTGTCRPGVQACVGGTYSGACMGAVGPSPELCDGLDNNCNGMVDEGDPGGGARCGIAGVGVCTAGTVHCVSGHLVCTGGMMPTPETCNGLDDDCNGTVDDGVPGTGVACTGGLSFPTSPPMGACRLGATVCAAGMLVCQGAVGPSMEICDGIDNNCNGMIDEGLAGGPCGSDVGACRPGTLVCMGGRSVCQGAVGPSPEVCDGIDNDCNGMTDEGNPGGGARCGSDVGECVPGVLTCVMGMLTCQGERGPTDEVCDGLDNDCDGSVDEDLPPGGPCGSSVGICQPGTLRCIAGHEVCEGGIGPRPEECNCLDDDCDGTVDNAPSGAAGLCGDGAVCAGAPQCQCLRRCQDGEFPCPVGRTCERVGSDDLCVGDTCANVTCPTNQHCVGGACHSYCDGVTCASGLACDPRTGRCVQNNCVGLGCPTGQLCVNGACEANPCDAVQCPSDQACANGQCVATCAGVTCPMGQSCFQGTCHLDHCAGVTCTGTQVCDPSSGGCINNRCLNVSCPTGQICNPLTGVCADDPCAVVRCPAGQTCAAGSCNAPPVVRPTRDRVVGSGGGGACSVGATPGGARSGGLAAVVLALAAASAASAKGRRRRRNGARGAEVRS